MWNFHQRVLRYFNEICGPQFKWKNVSSNSYLEDLLTANGLYITRKSKNFFFFSIKVQTN